MENNQNRVPWAKKSLGQHFLTSEGAVKSMVDSAQLKKGDVVLEIGPGKGVLTVALLQAGAHVIAVEKDDLLITPLSEKFKKEIASGQLRIIHGDILTEDISQLTDKKKYKLVANIPYYITGEIMRMFLTAEHKPTLMTLLVQKEVAERIVAKNGKESVLSLSVKFFGTPTYICMVKRGSFNPPPNVDSAIIRIDVESKNDVRGTSHLDDGRQKIREEEFFKAIKTGFKSKRKKLISNLSVIYEKSALTQAFVDLSLDENTRAEDVSLEQWMKLLKYTNTRIDK